MHNARIAKNLSGKIKKGMTEGYSSRQVLSFIVFVKPLISSEENFALNKVYYIVNDRNIE